MLNSNSGDTAPNKPLNSNPDPNSDDSTLGETTPTNLSSAFDPGPVSEVTGETIPTRNLPFLAQEPVEPSPEDAAEGQAPAGSLEPVMVTGDTSPIKVQSSGGGKKSRPRRWPWVLLGWLFLAAYAALYIGAFCLTEAQAGSDSFNVKTRAHFDGTEWVINGEKLWITNGGIADIVSVFARTDRGIATFIVDTKTPGYQAGPAEKKMGIKGSTTNAITFDNVRVPKENLVGVDGRGFLIAMKTLDAGRLGLGAACLGASKELLELSVRYAKQRKQFEQTISNFQAIQFMLAEMATLVYAMDSIVYRTAYDYDLKKDISRQSAIVKLYCSEGLDKIADYAVQIHGGMGYSRELPIERYYRDSRINRIFEGTNEIQKGIIAREILKKNGIV